MERTVDMFDPIRDYTIHKKEYDNAISQVLNHGRFINGPEVNELEKKLSEFVGTTHCIAVGNGTDALQIALMSLNIGNGDEVITVSHTWISTVEAISLIGAIPVFVDIESDTFCMDIDQIESVITDKTRCIMVVSLYGQTPDYDRINEIANKYNIQVIEDGAQSFGAKYKGKRSCGLTTIGTTSFFPTKPLGCYGDGGACFTNDDNLANKIRAIKSHGGIKRFHHKYIGMNSRLDTIQASILLIKLKYFEKSLEERNRVANYYNKKLKILENSGLIELPKVMNNNYHVWAQYSILLNKKFDRDKVVEYLKENGINVSIFYPKPTHEQECFKYLNYDVKLPVTDKVCKTIINLPCYDQLSFFELTHIIFHFENLINKMNGDCDNYVHELEYN